MGYLLGVIFGGNAFNTLVFCILMLLTWLLQLKLRKAPRLLYKFVASYGIAIIFDFFLLMIVDIIRLVLYFSLSFRTGPQNFACSTIIIKLQPTMELWGYLLLF